VFFANNDRAGVGMIDRVIWIDAMRRFVGGVADRNPCREILHPALVGIGCGCVPTDKVLLSRWNFSWTRIVLQA